MLTDSMQLKAVHDCYTLGLETWLPVIPYDYTVHTIEQLLDKLDSLERRSKVVLLGDRANVRVPGQARYAVPFVSFTGVGCSEWLAQQLDEAEIPEHALEWFNAYSSTGAPLDASLLPEGLPVVALGRNASQWCVERGITHRLCPHPQSHKRFYSALPYPLLTTLKELLA